MRRVAMLVVAAAVLSACTSTVAGRPAAPAALKWQRPIISAVTGLGTALGPVGDAMIGHDLPAMVRACAGLRAPLDRLEHQLPTPDPAVNDALGRSVSSYRSFATTCMALSPANAPTALDQLTDDLTRGDTAMRTALDHMGIQLAAR